MKPKYAIPVHGEYRHLIAQAKVAEELGIPKENIFLLSSGDVLELNDEAAAVTGRVHTGAIMVDGLGVGDVGNIVLRDRQHLAEDGIVIALSSCSHWRAVPDRYLPDRISYRADLSMSAAQRD